MDINLLGTRRFLKTPFPVGNQLEPTNVQSEAQPQNSTFTNPAMPALDKYNSALDAMPNRDDYDPRLITKILAAVAGVGEGIQRGPVQGIALNKQILDKPYDEALGRWGTKLSRYEKEADIESKRNTAMLGSRKEDREDRLANNTVNNTNSEIADRIDLQRYRGNTIVNGDDGHVWNFNPYRPAADLGKPNESKVESDIRALGQHKKFGEVDDKLLRGRMQLGNSLDIGKMRVGSGLNIEEHTANRQTDADNPIPQVASPYVQPSQTDIADSQAVEQVVREHPEYATFVVRDPNNQAYRGTAPKNQNSVKWQMGDDASNFALFAKRVAAKRDEIVNATRKPNVFTRVPGSPLNSPKAESKTVSPRDAAIAALNEAKAPITEANIAAAMEQLAGGVK
jgi:hypothetical protein